MDMSYWMLLFYLVGTVVGAFVAGRFWIARGAESALNYLIEQGYLITVLSDKGELEFIKPELREK